MQTSNTSGNNQTATPTPSTATISLDSLLVGKVDITPPEHDDERDARLRHEGYDLNVARFKDVVMFLFSIALVAVMIWLCVQAVMAGTADDKRWATSILTGAASGLIGYLIRQKK